MRVVLVIKSELSVGEEFAMTRRRRCGRRVSGIRRRHAKLFAKRLASGTCLRCPGKQHQGRRLCYRCLQRETKRVKAWKARNK